MSDHHGTPARLTTAESLMLDIIRVVAAIVVAFGHLTRAPFSTGWTDFTFLAREAVSVFFVLSGFVIRYVTQRRPVSLEHYLGDRASRIYSVAIPALLLCWLTDSVARHINPGFYANWGGDYSYAPVRILINLLFCGQLWSHPVNPLSDSAFWSVNYEVAYYIGYGLFFYLASKTRWLWILALALFCGPRIVYLAPLWIAGCIAHDLYQRWNAAGTAATWINSLMVLPVLAFAIVIFLGPAHPGISQLSAFAAFPHLYRMMNSVWVRPPEVAFGFLWVIIFLRLLLFARRFKADEKSVTTRAIRFISEGTFPIYLIHFPLFVLIGACIPYNHGDPLQKLGILTSVVLLGILAGHPCNLLKNSLRSFLFKRTTRPVASASLQRTTT